MYLQKSVLHLYETIIIVLFTYSDIVPYIWFDIQWHKMFIEYLFKKNNTTSRQCNWPNIYHFNIMKKQLLSENI